MTEMQEWIDGFLFVGNQTALDLLNTRLAGEDGPRELLPDVAALRRWLAAAGVADPAAARAALQPAAAAERFRQQLLAFRERLRAAVLLLESGKSPGAAFLAELNGLLARYPARMELLWRAGGVELRSPGAPQTPEELWPIILTATTALLTSTKTARVRKCASCPVHFHDTSKKGSRRWCSMNLCGNRLKVAAYRERRQRQQT